jgi:hypothetical protein
MAGVHTYKQMGKDVRIFAVDHSVGSGGRNKMDDVQLIQMQINRYIETNAVISKKTPGWTPRLVSKSGGQVAKLGVDGLCGPLTLAAILAVQRSLNIWHGCAVDGTISAIPEDGPSQYKDGTSLPSEDFVNGKFVRTRFMLTSFNTMYILAVTADFHAPPWDIFSLPEPLKSSLLRSSISEAMSARIFLQVDFREILLSM